MLRVGNDSGYSSLPGDAGVNTGNVYAETKAGNVLQHWARARDVAGLPEGFTFHDLRPVAHTSAAQHGATTKGRTARNVDDRGISAGSSPVEVGRSRTESFVRGL